jgi:DNA polymerase-1
MKLFLVDGHALAYRSYFAFIRNPLINSKGENTSAAFGFTRMMLLLMKKYHPDYLAVVFDSEEETHRHREYPEYKAQRDEMPDDLSMQFPMIIEILEALGVKILQMPGFEADDVIATMTGKAVSQGMDVRIVTGDKDLFQLLSDRVRIIRPGRGTALEDEIGVEYLRERFDLTPDQITDLLALMGDSSDNIPGVKGIGEKTALKLLHRFGSLEELLGRIDEITPEHVRKKVESGTESALFSKDLVSLHDVPLDEAPGDLTIEESDDERLSDVLLHLEFHQILRELSLQSDSAAIERNYTIIDESGLGELARKLDAAPEFVLDVETTSLDPMDADLVGIAFSTREGKAWYVPVDAGARRRGGGLFESNDEMKGRSVPLETVRDVLGPVMNDDRTGKIGHNIKYDLQVLEAHGFPVEGVSFDTMIASYCLDPERRSHSLDTLALEYCRHKMVSYKELFTHGDRERDIYTVPLEKLGNYSCEDADFTMRLKVKFERALADYGFEKLFREIEMPLSLVLKRMEQEGVAVDCGKLGILSGEISHKLEALTDEIHELAGEVFNINSNKQLQRILFDKLGLSATRKTKTGHSTDVEVLTELSGEHAVVGRILEYRKLAKMASTYIDALPRLVNPATGRIHTSFNQTVTSTGRLSSSEPNLQNIPIRTELGRKIRSAFIPREGNILMDADYSQIELRIMAHLSSDAALVDAFRAGIDVHTLTASRIYGVPEEDVSGKMRSQAKTINFGVIYGMGARGLSRQLGISIEEAKRFIGEYFEKYPGVKAYTEKSIERARENGFAETLLGRRRPLPDIGSEDGRVRSFSERIAVNMPIQGTAADMIKAAMIGIDRDIMERGLGSRMILQVHDELVFDVVPEERDEMKRLVRGRMESAADLSVPLKVDIGVGANWLEAH